MSDMDKQLQLIWKKLDNSLSKKEKLEFDILMVEDSAFKKLYESQAKLNTSLKSIPIVSAPVSMLDNILTAVHQKNRSYVKDYNSFSGIKFIVIAFIAVLCISTLSVFLINQPVNNWGSFNEVADWISSFQLLETFTRNTVKYTSYTILFTLLMIVAGIDILYRIRTQELKF